MKPHVLIAFTALVAAIHAHAQGTLFFANRVTGVFAAQVTHERYGNVPAGPAGSEFYGQLLAGPIFEALAPVGRPVEFRNDEGIGYITSGGVVTVPGVAPGSLAQVELVAWHKSLGDDWNAAVGANMGGWGRSGVITVATGGAGTPPSPPALLGVAGGTPQNTLSPFQITFLENIPEPSTPALALLGAALLCFRTRPAPWQGACRKRFELATRQCDFHGWTDGEIMPRR
jgi:hypothetical protein